MLKTLYTAARIGSRAATKIMPRPTDSPDVAASKTLSYILRHGAEKEGLHMRSDGFIKLTDVLGRPKMRDVDKDMVLRLVAENAKQRFELFYGLDPSPPVVKAKKGQGKGKGKGGPKPKPVLKGQSSADLESEKSAATGDAAETGDRKVQTVDAAQVDDLRKELSKATLQDPKPISTELPLISIPIPLSEGGDACSSGTTQGQAEGSTGEYFIRATQGHTIKVETAALLEEVKNDEEGRTKAGLLVHGTRWDLWDVLRESGLSRMARTHIHLAPALSDHRILPRPNSTLRIYLDLQKLLDAGIPVYTSSNGVVLTPGNEQGVVEKQYWSKAERRINGEWHTVLENGKEVEGAVDLANGTAAANEAVGSPVNP